MFSVTCSATILPQSARVDLAQYLRFLSGVRKAPQCLSVLVSDLEAQQRYFSYRAILVAIVSQTSIAHLSRDMLQNGVSHRCAFVKLSAKGGYRTILGEC